MMKNTTINKLDNLSIEFILASKSLNPFDTVITVYKGHYGDFPINPTLDALVEILSLIVESTKTVQLGKLLSELLPANRWKSNVIGMPDETPLNEIIVRYLVSELRNLTRDQFLVVAQIPNDMPMKAVITGLILPNMKYLNKSHFFETDTA
jgi:hypothetical protein